MKKIAKICFVIIGTMIGAGFASGQEIELFFHQHGMYGIIGICLSFVITGIIIQKVMKIVYTYNVKSYAEFLNLLIPNRIINKIIKTMVQLFLLISFYIMIAGFCAYFHQEWKVPIAISAIIVSVLCYATFCNNRNGIVSINTFLIPLLITFICYLGVKNIPFTLEYIKAGNLFTITSSKPFLWVISSVLYTSYNSIVLIPILIELENEAKEQKVISKVSIITTILLVSLGLILFSLLLRGKEYISELELPMLQIVKEFNVNYQLIYGGVIVVAIFTSAISAGYGFLKNATSSQKTYKKLIIIVCLFAIFIAHIGFSKLVKIWYPFFGVLGLFQIFYFVGKCIFLNVSFRTKQG